MKDVLIVGGGSHGMAHRIGLVIGSLARVSAVEFPALLEPGQPNENPFQGGGRGKGAKKRAAKERRMRGGY